MSLTTRSKKSRQNIALYAGWVVMGFYVLSWLLVIEEPTRDLAYWLVTALAAVIVFGCGLYARSRALLLLAPALFFVEIIAIVLGFTLGVVLMILGSVVNAVVMLLAVTRCGQIFPQSKVGPDLGASNRSQSWTRSQI
ncbi:hypothetical protein QPX09_02895 [Corynebacterium pseudodiphtheriticum]|uniref:hypothetical protein n=1 Tax=Corynebacterium pseudodiphtheriticum TaxID=37637 RepID=UPI002542AA4F|nr:hypothetical protein [Corynebacterium pseudodiphtheriticum]MDK4236532.1 hypothetical protein [Corynebacterium pseudodiphtheriticum]